MHKKISKGFKAQVLLCLGLSASAFSQADLGESTVIAARADQKIDSVIGSIFSEDASYFTNQGIQDLSAGLDSIPGISSTKTAGQRGAARGLLMRGLPTSDVQLRVDGVRISNSSFALNSVLGALTTSQFDRIEVLKGAQSSLYGDGAAAGVVSVSSSAGLEGGELYTELGSFDSALSTLRQSGWVGDLRYSFQIGAEYTANDTYGGNSEIPGFDNDYKNVFGHIRLAYDVSDDLTLGASYRKFNNRYENPQFGGSITDTDVELGTLFSQWQINDAWHTSLTGSALKSVIDAFSRSEYEQLGLAWENSYRVSDATLLAFGAEIEKSDYDNETTDAGDKYKAAYTNVNHWFGNQIRANAGVRYENYDSFGSEVTWTVGVAYEVIDDFTVRASTGTAFTAPTLPDLYAPATDFVIGNPDLKPETSRSWEVAFDYTISEAAEVTVTYFETIKEDAIQRPFFGTTFNSTGRSVANGVEASVQGQISEQLSYLVGYTHLDNQIVAGAADQSAFLNLVYQPSDIWNIGVKAIYEGDRVFGEELDSYTKVDLFANYRVNDSVTLSARIENLFEEEYSYFTGFGSDYPASRIGGTVGVSMKW